MCSSPLFNIIGNLEDVLMCDPRETSNPNAIKVYKVTKDHKVGDYICYASNRQCALEVSKIWESKCIEKLPWLKDFIKFTIAPHGFNVSLCRSLCFYRGLEDVVKADGLYGQNSLFLGKKFNVSVVDSKDPRSLTSLRMDIVNDVLSNIIQTCGGAFDSCNPCVRLVVSNINRDIEGDVIVYVGPVICLSFDKKTAVDSDLYKRSRLQDISSMCDLKLDLNESATFEDKNKLLQATVIFDFFKSTLWRSVTLRVLDESKNEKSSCKDALFVLYNYARLSTLCSQFDEKVLFNEYSSLPPLEETDFNLLTQEEEWKLMYLSIMSWPGVFKNSVVDLETGRPKIHLIFEFLKTTANNFSHYYHRTRIFTEPRSHLLPILFARMHLLKCLLQVFKIALKIVCITPLNKM